MAAGTGVWWWWCAPVRRILRRQPVRGRLYGGLLVFELGGGLRLCVGVCLWLPLALAPAAVLAGRNPGRPAPEESDLVTEIVRRPVWFARRPPLPGDEQLLGQGMAQATDALRRHVALRPTRRPACLSCLPLASGGSEFPTVGSHVRLTTPRRGPDIDRNRNRRCGPAVKSLIAAGLVCGAFAGRTRFAAHCRGTAAGPCISLHAPGFGVDQGGDGRVAA